MLRSRLRHAPRIALFSPSGEWDAENVGVPPDIQVEMTPQLVIQGHDPQLERAVAVVLDELARIRRRRTPWRTRRIRCERGHLREPGPALACLR